MDIRTELSNIHADFDGRLIGLWGAARCGKDSICKALGWPRAAFADALKRDLATPFANMGLDVLGNDAHKSIARETLVGYGRAGRAVDPHYWIKRLELPNTPRMFRTGSYGRMPGLTMEGVVRTDDNRVCVTDVRYFNEIMWILLRGGIVFEIHRPGVDPANEEERRSFREIYDRRAELLAVAPLSVGIPRIVNDRTPADAAFDVAWIADQVPKAAA